ncbi:hypothetical protein [Micromonospora auratinigra]|uniref:Uncharacterized protein n=1 Tax=Micromonospora auratinigra TaxID=261654 RepID=A0A1A9A379_9ACTN|nr:hypothetical protein [Micromonospora auratinigra]SBT50896.1 hypothetical protein GA0070611_4940 [Micromonospora auratinigra]
MGGDGHEERGMAAVARAPEHLHLAGDLLGRTLRLPGPADRPDRSPMR